MSVKFVTNGISKLDRSRLVIALQPLNILDMLVTLDVFQVVISKSVNLVQPLNIDDMSATTDVFQPVMFMLVNSVQPLNILLILATLIVFHWLRSSDSAKDQSLTTDDHEVTFLPGDRGVGIGSPVCH